MSKTLGLDTTTPITLPASHPMIGYVHGEQVVCQMFQLGCGIGIFFSQMGLHVFHVAKVKENNLDY